MELLENLDKVLKDLCKKVTDDYVKDAFGDDKKLLLIKQDVLETLTNRLRPLEGYCGLVLGNMEKLDKENLTEYRNVIAENLLLKLEMYTMNNNFDFRCMAPGNTTAMSGYPELWSKDNMVRNIMEAIQADLISTFKI